MNFTRIHWLNRSFPVAMSAVKTASPSLFFPTIRDAESIAWMYQSVTVPVERIRMMVRRSVGTLSRRYRYCTCHAVSVPDGAGTCPDIIDRPVFVSSLGRASEDARVDSCAQFTNVSDSGGTPGIGEDAWVASAPSSIGQYASGPYEGMRRRSVD